MTETLVTNLRPWTVYHLRVFAENQLGKSKDGKVLQVILLMMTYIPHNTHAEYNGLQCQWQ